MAEEYGVPARELSDEELERQGVHAHATRHWVFLHGTSDQFRTHTQRMLELEQEYLRRHPQRTWQGTGGVEGSAANALARGGGASAEDPDTAKSKLLEAFAATPDGSLHKLEAHQIARTVAPNARLVASLYKTDPPLLRAEGDARVITNEGRAWLAAHPTT
jgi:hypothetical protein